MKLFYARKDGKRNGREGEDPKERKEKKKSLIINCFWLMVISCLLNYLKPRSEKLDKLVHTCAMMPFCQP